MLQFFRIGNIDGYVLFRHKYYLFEFLLIFYTKLKLHIVKSDFLTHLFSQLIQRIKMHGKIEAPDSYLSNAKKVLPKAPKTPNPQFLLEMM